MTLNEKLNAEFDLFRAIKLQQPKCSVFSSSFEIELRKRICRYLIEKDGTLKPETKEVMLYTPNLLDEISSYLCDKAQLKSLPEDHFTDGMEAWLATFSAASAV